MCREYPAGTAAGRTEERDEQVRRRDAVPACLGGRTVDRPADLRADRRSRVAGRRVRPIVVGLRLEGGANGRRIGAERADDGAGQPGRVVEDRNQEITTVDRVVAEPARAHLGVAQAAERTFVERLQDAGADQIIDGQLRDQRCISPLRTLPGQTAWRPDVGPRISLGAGQFHEEADQAVAEHVELTGDPLGDADLPALRSLRSDARRP